MLLAIYFIHFADPILPPNKRDFYHIYIYILSMLSTIHINDVTIMHAYKPTFSAFCLVQASVLFSLVCSIAHSFTLAFVWRCARTITSYYFSIGTLIKPNQTKPNCSVRPVQFYSLSLNSFAVTAAAVAFTAVAPKHTLFMAMHTAHSPQFYLPVLFLFLHYTFKFNFIECIVQVHAYPCSYV